MPCVSQYMLIPDIMDPGITLGVTVATVEKRQWAAVALWCVLSQALAGKTSARGACGHLYQSGIMRHMCIQYAVPMSSLHITLTWLCQHRSLLHSHYAVIKRS